MSELGEFEIIERFFSRSRRDRDVLVGVGDDAAIVEAAGPLAIAVDMLVEGTHFPHALPAAAIGHRALAVNLSDLAAVAAKPRWATLAISLPGVDEDWLEGFAAGFYSLAERFGVSLVGGDTTRGPLTVTVQLIGEAPRAAPLRSGGRPGDLVFVSGTLGDAAAGLECFVAAASRPAPTASDGREAPAEGGPETEPAAVDEAHLIARFAYPEPRVALGAALAGIARAAIDVSDGLAADLGHICERSGCGARVDLAALPLSRALRASHAAAAARELALHGGDDYELCFCVAPADRERALAAAAAAGTPITVIGALTAERAIVGTVDGEARALEPRGFRHF
jgi:thiamine-monophosphate kinase